MKKNIPFLIAFLSFFLGYSQEGVWQITTAQKTDKVEKIERRALPSKYLLYSLDLEELKRQLFSAPSIEDGVESNLIISFPNPEGGFGRFKIYNAPCMDSELAQKYPGINSYAGQGLDEPGSTIRFSMSNYSGLNAIIFGTSDELGTAYIDAYSKDKATVIVYRKNDYTPFVPFSCNVKVDNNPIQQINRSEVANKILANNRRYRRYRLAVATTTEYSTYHINAAGAGAWSVAARTAVVLDAINVAMTRVNGLYEKDLCVNLQLVANNDLLINLGADPFINDDADSDISTGVISDLIGQNNYDIGHVFGTNSGVAWAGTVCWDNSRADGKGGGTTGVNPPINDRFYVDYVCHEMGHQFNAMHTWAGTSGECTNSRREEQIAVEPGSGSTLMCYAGLCAPQNVQNNSDDYFHASNLVEIEGFIINGIGNNIGRAANCHSNTAILNNPPVLVPVLDYNIPEQTPYFLIGNANDPDVQDVPNLTYCWEQTDIRGNAVQPPAANATQGPMFRSRPATLSPRRVFPRLNFIATGTNYQWEVLSNLAAGTSRNFNFALTVRDNRVGGGQTEKDNVVVTVQADAGPFTVTSQNVAGIVWQGGSTQTVTWNVAGTTANNINCANVRILLSTIGAFGDGSTYPTRVLLASTPNDGSADIIIPNDINSTTCRVFVEAVGNIFFNMNSQNITIQRNLSTENFEITDFSVFPNPNVGEFTIKFNSTSKEDINVVVHDIRGRLIFEKKYNNTGVISQRVQLENIQSGLYFVTVRDGFKKAVKQILVK